MIDEQALAWVIRTRDPEFSDWEGFTRWLEGAPAHARAYDVLADADAGLAVLLPPAPVLSITTLPVAANDEDVGPRRFWRWAAMGSVAAALVAIVSVNMVHRTDIYAITTGSGERRDVMLADGTRIALNSDSVIHLDRAKPRLATLDRGEATFTVTHDPSDPFRVSVGKAVLEDVGTVFNVTRDGPFTRVGVSEGSVVYNPGREAIALPVGRSLSVADGDASPTVGAVAPLSVGSWRTGRLIYADTAVAAITGDLTRNLGITVRATPGASAVRFTGTMVLDRDPARFFAATGPLLGLEAVRERDGWVLKEANAAAH
jgi:transmembrane sensor